MKERLTITEKITVINQSLEVARDENDLLNIIGFEISSVYHIARAYCGDIYDVEDEEGMLDIILTYENITADNLWETILGKNQDMRFTLKLAKERYEEQFRVEISLEDRIVKLLEKFIEKIPNAEEIDGIMSKNKDFMNSVNQEDRDLIDKLLSIAGGVKNVDTVD